MRMDEITEAININEKKPKNWSFRANQHLAVGAIRKNEQRTRNGQ